MKQIIIGMVIIATIAAFGAVQYADAEIFSLRGVDEKINIMMIKEGPDIVVLLYDRTGSSVHFDTKLKEYKSGGFSLKSPNTGLALWAHPTGENHQYEITIFTNEGIKKYLTKVVDLNVVEEIHSTSQTRAAPKSSVGVDITKYDIPTDTKRSAEPAAKPSKMIVKFTQLDELMMDSLGRYNISAENIHNPREKMSYANMTMEISRNGEILKEVKTKANILGKWHPVFEVSYPTFYPGFCYDVKIITQYENFTDIQHDDFKIVVDVNHDDFKIVTEKNEDTDYSEKDQAVTKKKIDADYFCNKNDTRK